MGKLDDRSAQLAAAVVAHIMSWVIKLTLTFSTSGTFPSRLITLLKEGATRPPDKNTELHKSSDPSKNHLCPLHSNKAQKF